MNYTSIVQKEGYIILYFKNWCDTFFVSLPKHVRFATVCRESVSKKKEKRKIKCLKIIATKRVSVIYMNVMVC